MGKTAFIFPGQGSQYVGMGKDFYEKFPAARDIFDKASEASGLDVAALCFEENEQIHITEYTQIAMLTVEVALLKVLEEMGYRPDVMDVKDLFYCVRKRGIFMQEAVPTGGAMTAILGLDSETIAKACEETEGIVSVANYNCPGQTVITGEAGAVNAASERLKELGAKRCVPLKVSGPFHSPMLKGAGEKLGQVLADISLKEIRVPYLSNVTGDYVADTSQVKELLVKQVSSSVRWQECVERMIADGVDTFVEIGPGKSLSGFMRKINRDVTVINVEKAEDLEKLPLSGRE